MGETGKVARELGRDFINDNTVNPHLSPYIETLYRVETEMDETFETALHEWLKHFQQYDKETIKAILDKMFEDGTYSWGRIAMVYIFVRKCAQQCREQGKADKHTIEQLAQFVGEYVKTVAHSGSSTEEVG